MAWRSKACLLCPRKSKGLEQERGERKSERARKGERHQRDTRERPFRERGEKERDK